MAISWLKTGKASADLAKKAENEVLQKKEQQGKLFRFRLKDNEEGSITFVDGALSEDGFLLPTRVFEHNLYLNNSWGNHYVCPEKTDESSGQKCPICASGDNPSLVALFTIIDHRIQKSKDGTKTYFNQPRLLVVKSPTFEILNKIALKRGGLAGATFDVSRIGDKSASVGSMFDFQSKEEDLDVLRAKYTRTYKDKEGKDVTETVFKVADYENELTYHDAAGLIALGFGKPAAATASGNYGAQM